MGAKRKIYYFLWHNALFFAILSNSEKCYTI